MSYKMEYPSFSAMAKINSNSYFSDNYTNSLFKLDISTAEIEYITAFPNEMKDELIHCCAFVVGDAIVFIPDQGNVLHVIDIKDHNISSVSVNKLNDSRYAINDCILIDDMIWIFPGDGVNEIMTFDVNSMCLEKQGVINRSRYNNGKNVFFYNVVHKERIVYMVEYGTRFIVAYDIDKKSSKVIDTGVDNLLTLGIANNTIWISSSHGIIYKYDENRNKLIAYSIENCQNKNPWLVFSILDCTMIVSEQGGYVYRLDEKRKRFVKMKNLYIEQTNGTCKGEIYRIYEYGEEVIFSVPRGINCLQRLRSSYIHRSDLKLLNYDAYHDIKIHTVEKKLNNRMLLIENSDLNLFSYIELIAESDI